ncbi:MAG: hypothetical protein KAS32_29745 [Candidatus Peribacteraceae bacterium]|nr:hypothetical protein [Candidatus Peribacteraceae bacterium]
MKSAITTQFIKQGRILTTQEHKDNIIKELTDHTRQPLAVEEYPSGAVTIRKTHAVTMDLGV